MRVAMPRVQVHPGRFSSTHVLSYEGGVAEMAEGAVRVGLGRGRTPMLLEG